MIPVGLGTKNRFADEDQLQFSSQSVRPTEGCAGIPTPPLV
jgi:hypothetical protein